MNPEASIPKLVEFKNNIGRSITLGASLKM